MIPMHRRRDPNRAMTERSLGASFRDPSGYLFERDGELYRRVRRSYADHYDCLMESGLYAELVEGGLLIPHEAVDDPSGPDGHIKKNHRPANALKVGHDVNDRSDGKALQKHFDFTDPRGSKGLAFRFADDASNRDQDFSG